MARSNQTVPRRRKFVRVLVFDIVLVTVTTVYVRRRLGGPGPLDPVRALWYLPGLLHICGEFCEHLKPPQGHPDFSDIYGPAIEQFAQANNITLEPES